MDYIDRLHDGFQKGILSPSDVARACTEPLNPDSFQGKDYDATFLSIVLRRPTQGSSAQKKKNSLVGIVRTTKQDEQEVLEGLFVAFQKELYGRVQDVAPEDALVLEHSEGIAGVLWYQIHPDDRFFVHSLYVRPELRKFHCGRKLMEEAMQEYAPSFGCRSLALRAPEHVVPFYRKLGFSYDPRGKDEARTCRSLVKKII